MRCCFGLFLLAFFTPLPVQPNATSSSIKGDWREPGGSVIRIAQCDAGICATLIAISADAPDQKDAKNPHFAARSHSLCGLVIGKGFHLSAQQHAEGGTLYDPKSGKTYHGEMTAEGNTLSLRGYVGIRLFGRTETWTRTHAVSACHPS